MEGYNSNTHTSGAYHEPLNKPIPLVNAEKYELKRRVRHMSQEEMEFVLKCYPTELLWNELKRRDNALKQRMYDIFELVKAVDPEKINMGGMEAFNDSLRGLLNI